MISRRSYFDESSEFIYGDQDSTMPLSDDEFNGYDSSRFQQHYGEDDVEHDTNNDDGRTGAFFPSSAAAMTTSKFTSTTFSKTAIDHDNDKSFDYFDYEYDHQAQIDHDDDRNRKDDRGRDIDSRRDTSNKHHATQDYDVEVNQYNKERLNTLDETIISTRTTDSPPPPPPPLGASYDKSANIGKNSYQSTSTSNHEIDKTGDAPPQNRKSSSMSSGNNMDSNDKVVIEISNNNNPSPAASPTGKKGPFPFLKKNTRKEPSAIHRLNSPSPNKQQQQQQPQASSSNFSNDRLESQASTKSKPSANKSPAANVRPSPSKSDDYWGLENTLHQDIKAIGGKQTNDANNNKPQNTGQRPGSTKSLNGVVSGQFEWDVQGELAEFEKYEKQVQQEERRNGQYEKCDHHNHGGFSYDNDDESIGYKFDKTSGNNNKRIEANEPQYGVGSSGNMNGRSAGYSSHATIQSNNDERYAKSTQSWGSVTQPSLTNTKPDSIKRGYSSGSTSTFAPKPLKDDNDSDMNTDVDSNADLQATAGPTYHQLKLIRPVSTLKNQQTKTISVSNKIDKKPDGKPVDKIQLALEQKAKELEEQLEAYRNENNSLKKLKKQQEQALTEILQKKEELNKYCEDERLKTIQWCEEQKQNIEKEKRTAAKQIREMKLKAVTGPSVPIRKEKAEMEALQATVEKLKVDHETASKKWKVNENRLYGLIKEHSQHIENLEKQLLALEEQKIMLLDFVAQSGLRLPKNIRQKLSNSNNNDLLQTNGNKQQSNSNKLSQTTSRASRISGDKGYAEEVDIEVYPAYSNYHHMDDPQATAQRIHHLLHDDAIEMQHTQSQKLTAAPGEVFNRLAVINMKSTTSAPGYRQSNGDTLLSDPRNVGASWARSSRSSARYSESGGEEDDMIGNDEAHGTASTMGTTTRFAFKGATSPKQPANHQSDHNSRGDGTPKSRAMPSGASWSASMEVQKPATLTTTVSMQKTTPQDKRSNKTTAPSSSSSSSNTNSGERVEEVKPDGSRVIKYRNGTIKEVDPSGKSIIIFTNGDSKKTDPTTGMVVYFYAQANTTHTTYKDGTEIYEFPNGQVERHFPGGKKEVTFPDHTKKTIFADGIQETSFPDGVILREHPDGRKEVIEKPVKGIR